MKRTTRCIALLLALLLLATPAFAAKDGVVRPETDSMGKIGAELVSSVVELFRHCDRTSGLPSYAGYCAGLVDRELYSLDIIRDYPVTPSGNVYWESWRDRNTTSTGYGVRAYACTAATLEKTLRDLSYDGLRDTYNMVLCIQRTNQSWAGNRWGHVVFLNAIVDGKCYFVDSVKREIQNVTYKIGDPIVCTIPEFCEIFRDCDIEGIIKFTDTQSGDLNRYAGVRNLRVEIDGHTAHLRWDALPNLTGYLVTVRRDGELVASLRTDLTDCDVTFEELGSYTCSVTGNTTMSRIGSSVTVELTAHNFEETVLEAATCGTSGSKLEVCTVCGAAQESIIPASGAHSYLASEMGAEGIACTACGHEKGGTDSADLPFLDLPTDHYAWEPVFWLYSGQFCVGKSETYFGVRDACTQAEALTLLWNCAGKPEVETAVLQEDSVGRYYEMPLRWATAVGILSEEDAAAFDAGKICTRGQFVTLLWQAMGGSSEAWMAAECAAFPDVPADSACAAAVAWAKAAGVSNGVSADRFGADEACTRGIAAAMLWRAMVGTETK